MHYAWIILEWNFFLIPEKETTARKYSRILSSQSAPMSDLEVNSITFIFSRISAAGSLPLISRLVINPVSDGLNGIEVNCTDALASNSASTYIRVINESTVTRSKLINYLLSLTHSYLTPLSLSLVLLVVVYNIIASCVCMGWGGHGDKLIIMSLTD